jgi:uncharacterized membrane protein
MANQKNTYSKIKLFGHPLHPMMIAFPLILFTATLACFVAYRNNADAFWFKAGYVTNMGGICLGLVGALPGFMDWLAIPSRKQIKRTGAKHLLLNLLGLAVCSINHFMIRDEWTSPTPDMKYSVLLTATGFFATLFASALGWTMMQTYYMGVLPRTEEETFSEPFTATFGPNDAATTLSPLSPLSPVRDRERYSPDTREPSEL